MNPTFWVYEFPTFPEHTTITYLIWVGLDIYILLGLLCSIPEVHVRALSWYRSNHCGISFSLIAAFIALIVQVASLANTWPRLNLMWDYCDSKPGFICLHDCKHFESSEQTPYTQQLRCRVRVSTLLTLAAKLTCRGERTHVPPVLCSPIAANSVASSAANTANWLTVDRIIPMFPRSHTYV